MNFILGTIIFSSNGMPMMMISIGSAVTMTNRRTLNQIWKSNKAPIIIIILLLVLCLFHLRTFRYVFYEQIYLFTGLHYISFLLIFILFSNLFFSFLSSSQHNKKKDNKRKKGTENEWYFLHQFLRNNRQINYSQFVNTKVNIDGHAFVFFGTIMVETRALFLRLFKAWVFVN